MGGIYEHMKAADVNQRDPSIRGRRGEDNRPKINWSAIAIIVSVGLWLLGAGSGLFGDYRKIGDRVTALEADRRNDAYRMQRLEDKIDRLLERVK